MAAYFPPAAIRTRHGSALRHSRDAVATGSTRGRRRQQLFHAGHPALQFLRAIRSPKLANTVQTFKHKAAVLSGGSKFRQSLDRTCLVQMHDEELLTSDFPEACVVGNIFRGHHAADFLQGSEATVIHFPDRLEEISDGAHKSLNGATAVDGAFQVGTHAIGNGLACHIALGTPSQAGVLGIQADHRLHQGGAVKSKEVLLCQRIARLSP